MNENNKYIAKYVSQIHRKSRIFMNREVAKYDIKSGQLMFLLDLYMKDGKNQEEISKKLENSSEMTQESSQLKSLHKAQPSCRIGFPFSHVSKSSGHILYLHVCFVFSYLFRTCLLLIATQITNII